MRLKLFRITVIAMLIAISSAVIAHAEYRYAITAAPIAILSGWTEIEGGFASTANGVEGWTSMSPADTYDGLFATFTVTSADCSGYCMAKIERYVGIYNGNRLRAEIRIEKYGDTQNIRYVLREYDPESGSYLSDLARGYFGPNTGQNWEVGDAISLAAAIEGNEIIFYTDKQTQIAKVQMLNLITPLAETSSWRIGLYTQGNSDTISVTTGAPYYLDVSQ